MNRLVAPFRRLRWKLTLTYTGVTVGALLVVEAALVVLLLVAYSSLVWSGALPRLLTEELRDATAPTLRPCLDPTPDRACVDDWLARRTSLPLDTPGAQVTIESNTERSGVLIVTDATGDVLGQWPPDALPGLDPGDALDPALIAGLEEPFRAALAGETGVDDLHAVEGTAVISAAPVFDRAGEDVLGVLIQTSDVPGSLPEFAGALLPLFGGSLLAFTLIAGAVGTLFGFLTARALVRRIDRLAYASEAWSQGDFSAFVQDSSGDELGQLARRMNRMAEQLQNLLAVREDLAVLEERNRLARDLHDSVKQQAFAASAQLGAARALLEADPGASARRLDEAEDLIDRLRKELTGLIYELRPVALGDRGLAAALNEYVERWSWQVGIAGDVEVDKVETLPAAVEEGLFRIAQEALANASRHSGTDRVAVRLATEPNGVTLTVTDDGRGFDPDTVEVGLGLRSMAERAAALGAAFAVESAPGEGTQVTVRWTRQQATDGG